MIDAKEAANRIIDSDTELDPDPFFQDAAAVAFAYLAARREIEVLRHFGNKDCTHMADRALEIERAGGEPAMAGDPVLRSPQ